MDKNLNTSLINKALGIEEEAGFEVTLNAIMQLKEQKGDCKKCLKIKGCAERYIYIVFPLHLSATPSYCSNIRNRNTKDTAKLKLHAVLTWC